MAEPAVMPSVEGCGSPADFVIARFDSVLSTGGSLTANSRLEVPQTKSDQKFDCPKLVGSISKCGSKCCSQSVVIFTDNKHA